MDGDYAWTALDFIKAASYFNRQGVLVLKTADKAVSTQSRPLSCLLSLHRLCIFSKLFRSRDLPFARSAAILNAPKAWQQAKRIRPPLLAAGRFFPAAI